MENLISHAVLNRRLNCLNLWSNSNLRRRSVSVILEALLDHANNSKEEKSAILSNNQQHYNGYPIEIIALAACLNNFILITLQ